MESSEDQQHGYLGHGVCIPIMRRQYPCQPAVAPLAVGGSGLPDWEGEWQPVISVREATTDWPKGPRDGRVVEVATHSMTNLRGRSDSTGNRVKHMTKQARAARLQAPKISKRSHLLTTTSWLALVPTGRDMCIGASHAGRKVGLQDAECTCPAAGVGGGAAGTRCTMPSG